MTKRRPPSTPSGARAEYARAFAAKVVVVSVAAPEPLAEVGAPGRSV